MLGWLLSRFRKRMPDDEDSKWLEETADNLTDSVMDIFWIQFGASQCSPSEIPQHKEFFVASYVVGFCDVMAQAVGARAGGNLSMTLSARIMQKIFGNTHGEYMWQKVDAAMHARNQTCWKAVTTGAEDANLFLRKGPALSLAEYLSE
jgi:hypothetical protein